jgi:hypothetical protein
VTAKYYVPVLIVGIMLGTIFGFTLRECPTCYDCTPYTMSCELESINERGVIVFNLSGIPANQTITEAKLYYNITYEKAKEGKT